MTRIIAGELSGRQLDVPPSARPTTDRVREAMFSSLGHELGGWAGQRVLDVFAGSGALGLEALSRGAATADFVEQNRSAAAVLRRNLARLGAAARSQVVVADATRWRPARSYDLVLVDPPYALAADAVSRLLADLAIAGGLADGALVVVERSSRDPANPLPADWEVLRRRRYGETTIWYGRAKSSPGDQEDT